MTPSLVKASFITRSNTCGFPETNKTIVVILTMFPLKKQVQYFYATYIVHVWKITEKPTSHFYLEMTVMCKLQTDIIQSFKLYFSN